MIRPGLVSVTFRSLRPREIVALATSAGLAAIEWGGDIHVTSPLLAQEAREMTGAAGLEVAAFGSYWRAETADFEPVLEIAVELGAPTVRVWAGTVASDASDSGHFDNVAMQLRRACAMAAAEGMTVSLEYHPNTLTDTLASTLRLIDEVDHANLRVYWQPVPQRSHSERVAEIPPLLPWLTNLHVFNWIPSDQGLTRRPLSEAEDQWPDYLAAAGGERFALLEFVPNDDPDALSAEAATLRHWLSQLS